MDRIALGPRFRWPAFGHAPVEEAIFARASRVVLERSFHSSRLDEAERGQRIDEHRRPLRRRRALGQLDHLPRLEQPVIGIHVTADHSDAFPLQLPDIAAGGDDGAGTFIADGEGLPDAALHGGEARLGDAEAEGWGVAFFGALKGGEVGGAEEQAEVARVDRRRFDADDDLVVGEVGDVDWVELEGERAVLVDPRPELASGECHDPHPGGEGSRWSRIGRTPSVAFRLRWQTCRFTKPLLEQSNPVDSATLLDCSVATNPGALPYIAQEAQSTYHPFR